MWSGQLSVLRELSVGRAVHVVYRLTRTACVSRFFIKANQNGRQAVGANEHHGGGREWHSGWCKQWWHQPSPSPPEAPVAVHPAIHRCGEAKEEENPERREHLPGVDPEHHQAVNAEQWAHVPR